MSKSWHRISIMKNKTSTRIELQSLVGAAPWVWTLLQFFTWFVRAHIKIRKIHADLFSCSNHRALHIAYELWQFHLLIKYVEKAFVPTQHSNKFFHGCVCVCVCKLRYVFFFFSFLFLFWLWCFTLPSRVSVELFYFYVMSCARNAWS